MYEECPLKYKLRYRDKVTRERETIESFLGGMVHEALKRCYDDARLGKVNSLEELFTCYDNLWQKNWHDGIFVTREDLAADHYRAAGRKMLETYYKRHAPFDEDITIGSEMNISFSLDDAGKYKFRGVIDRLAKSHDGAYLIHDYKTSSYLPSQEEIDSNRQLTFYQIGVQKRWPDVKEIKLVWHFLAFDCQLVSQRSQEHIDDLTRETINLIDEIEATREFPPRESQYCEWCEYGDLCPTRKHFYLVETLPPDEYLNEPGVVLVNKYAELKQKADEIGEEIEKVKQALLKYAEKQGVTVVRGSRHQARIRFDEKLKFPRKGQPEREELDEAIIQAGKWLEVSELDTAALARVVEEGLWDKKLIDQVLEYGRIEKTTNIRLLKLREEE